MKSGFYFSLALTGIKKNKKLYLPYILTCIGMVAMFFIVASQSFNTMLDAAKGGATARMILTFGRYVVAVFAGIFLIYTNSFLMRRRRREFGLYSILGMGKASIIRIITAEAITVAGISTAVGLFIGILTSKLAELGLVNMLDGAVDYNFRISGDAILHTAVDFAVIFAVIFALSVKNVATVKPIELLHSENLGEKPPKAKWVIAVIGAVLLGVAYYLAVSIEKPLEAIAWFFVAVIMVILGTYALFIAGSVAYCKLLQRNKGYYYKPNHFFSVSSMTYRMKRNGAGLASICILSTMVLVMISSASCLYFGTDESLNNIYPSDIMNEYFLETTTGSTAAIAEAREKITSALDENGVKTANVVDCRVSTITGYVTKDGTETDVGKVENITADMMKNVFEFRFIPLEDYNRTLGKSETLADDEVIIFTTGGKYPSDRVKINGTDIDFKVAKVTNDKLNIGNAMMSGIESVNVVLPNYETDLDFYDGLTDEWHDPILLSKWYYCFDTPDMTTDNQNDFAYGYMSDFNFDMLVTNHIDGIRGYSYSSKELIKEDYYGTYGGLFFLGILLSIVFLFATVLIIYYKQISEGYEDADRFDIMMKVGMTKVDIRRSINSQMMSVFLLPLGFAILHLAFAFPMIRRMLMVFNLDNLPLLLSTAGVSVALFAVFYAVVYKITSNAYYKIVSDANN